MERERARYAKVSSHARLRCATHECWATNARCTRALTRRTHVAVHISPTTTGRRRAERERCTLLTYCTHTHTHRHTTRAPPLLLLLLRRVYTRTQRRRYHTSREKGERLCAREDSPPSSPHRIHDEVDDDAQTRVHIRAREQDSLPAWKSASVSRRRTQSRTVGNDSRATNVLSVITDAVRLSRSRFRERRSDVSSRKTPVLLRRVSLSRKPLRRGIDGSSARRLLRHRRSPPPPSANTTRQWCSARGTGRATTATTTTTRLGYSESEILAARSI